MNRPIFRILLGILFLTFLIDTAIRLPVSGETVYTVVHVNSYGAVGDGVTDDTKAIQAALCATGSAPSIVKFEPGRTYLMQGEVYLYSNTQIQLCGATIRDSYPGGVTDPYVEWGNGLRFLNHPDSVTTTGYGALSNITICGGVFDGTCGDQTSGILFALLHASNVTFRDLIFRDCMAGTHVIDLGGCQNVTIAQCQFLGAQIANPSLRYREAIQLDSALYKGMPYWDGVDGIAYDGLACDRIHISGCTFAPRSGTQAINAIGTHTSYDYPNTRITISDNTFWDCYSYAIRLPKVSGLTITDNQFYSTGAHHADSACFISIPKKYQKNSSPMACSDIRIRRNTFYAYVKEPVIPVRITGYSKLPFYDIIIRGNRLKGTYQNKKSRSLWQCRHVQESYIQ